MGTLPSWRGCLRIGCAVCGPWVWRQRACVAGRCRWARACGCSWLSRTPKLALGGGTHIGPRAPARATGSKPGALRIFHLREHPWSIPRLPKPYFMWVRTLS